MASSPQTPSQLGDAVAAGHESNPTVDHELLAGSGRVVIAWLQYEQATTSGASPSATYGGNAMTEAGSGFVSSLFGEAGVHIFYILEDDLPADGTNELAFSNLSNTPDEPLCGAVCFEHLDQAAPDDFGGDDTSGDNPSVNLTSTVDNSLFLCVTASTSGGVTYTHGSGQTELTDIQGPDSDVAGASSYKVLSSAGTETMEQTSDSSANQSIFGVVFAPALTFDESIAESFSLDDTVATVITFAGEVAEALGLDASVTADLTFAGAVAEALELSDQVTNDMTFVAALAEVLGLDDTVAFESIIPVAVAESIALSDVVAAEFDINAAIAEALELSVQADADVTFPVALAESMGLSDAVSVEHLVPKEIEESLSFHDTVEAAVTVVAQYVEGLGIGDAVTARLTASVAVAEAFDLSDTVDMNLLFEKQVAEGITFGDLVELVYQISDPHTESIGFSVTAEATVAALGALRVLEVDAPLFDELRLASSVRDELSVDAEIHEDIRLPANLIGE